MSTSGFEYRVAFVCTGHYREYVSGMMDFESIRVSPVCRFQCLMYALCPYPRRRSSSSSSWSLSIFVSVSMPIPMSTFLKSPPSTSSSTPSPKPPVPSRPPVSWSLSASLRTVTHRGHGGSRDHRHGCVKVRRGERGGRRVLDAFSSSSSSSSPSWSLVSLSWSWRQRIGEELRGVRAREARSDVLGRGF